MSFLINDQLLHIVQKEKIAPKILEKIAGVNWPFQSGCFKCLSLSKEFESFFCVVSILHRCIFFSFLYFFQVLTECLLALRENKSVINLDLTETWWRSYQVCNAKQYISGNIKSNLLRSLTRSDEQNNLPITFFSRHFFP